MFKTNVKDVDYLIDSFINMAHDFFSIPIISLYLVGSYTDNSQIKTSDIDLVLVTDTFNYEEISKIKKFFYENSAKLFKIDIDLYILNMKEITSLSNEDLFSREAVANVVISGKLLYGDDIINQINKFANIDYVLSTAETPLHFISRVRGGKKIISSKDLSYPEELHEYFGYMDHGGSKQILSLIGWIATGLIALKTGTMVGKKSDVVKFYLSDVGDEWSDYVSDAFIFIRKKLTYKNPESEDEKKEIHEICHKLLDFEKYYLLKYEEFIQKQKN